MCLFCYSGCGLPAGLQKDTNSGLNLLAEQGMLLLCKYTGKGA